MNEIFVSNFGAIPLGNIQIAVSVESNVTAKCDGAICRASADITSQVIPSPRRRRVNNREIVIVFRADRPTTTRRPMVYDAGIKMGICGVCGWGEVEGADGEGKGERRAEGWSEFIT